MPISQGNVYVQTIHIFSTGFTVFVYKFFVRMKLDRNVAQPGRALALGAGGRRFESYHSDHFLFK